MFRVSHTEVGVPWDFFPTPEVYEINCVTVECSLCSYLLASSPGSLSFHAEEEKESLHGVHVRQNCPGHQTENNGRR